MCVLTYADESNDKIIAYIPTISVFVCNQKTMPTLSPGSQLKLNKEPGRQKQRPSVKNR